MELKQLEYFTIVCEKGSFSQAAECLYTSQPNVSKVISSLEKELGRKLVERSSRGLRITPYGETVRDYAKVILKHASLISSMATHQAAAIAPTSTGCRRGSSSTTRAHAATA